MKKFLFLSAVLFTVLSDSHAQQEFVPSTAPSDGSEALPPEVLEVFTPAVVIETIVTHQEGRDIIVQQLALDPNDPIEPVITQESVAIPADSDVIPSFYVTEDANLIDALSEREQASLAAEEETESVIQEESEYETVEEDSPSQPMDLIIRYRIAETPLLAASAEGGAQ